MSAARRMPWGRIGLAIASTLVAIGLPAPAGATFPGENGRIAYELELPGRIAIYSSDATGGDQQPVVDLGDRDAIDPAWARGGLQIAYAAQTEPGGPFAIFVADADGANAEQVTTPIANDTQPTWSPYGDDIAFTREMADGTPAVHIVDLATLDIHQAVFGNPSFDPSWSPGGGRIAFARTVLGNGQPCEIDEPGCRYSTFILHLDGDGTVTYFADGARSPEWFPDGDRIAATYVFGPEPIFTIVVMYDVATGEGLDQVMGNGVVSAPAVSPDAGWLAMRAFEPDDTGTILSSEITLVNFTDFEQLAIEGPVHDPAWAVIPGTEDEIVPDADTEPPELTFVTDVDPVANGWYPFRVELFVEARDASGVESIECTVDGEAGGNPTYVVGPGFDLALQFLVPDFFQPLAGVHEIVCTAQDGLGNSGETLTEIPIDTIPPDISDIIIAPPAVPLGGTFGVSACVEDEEVGLDEAFASTLAVDPVRLRDTGACRFVGELNAGGTPGPQSVQLWAMDLIGNERTTTAELMVFDPLTSAFGTGKITPGGPTSMLGDSWTYPLDGRRKGSFAVDVRYRKRALAPSGSFAFTYATTKFESRTFAWLVDGVVRGVGSFKGDQTSYPFELELSDGGPSGPDYLVLRVFGLGRDYRVSGEVSGQISLT